MGRVRFLIFLWDFGGFDSSLVVGVPWASRSVRSCVGGRGTPTRVEKEGGSGCATYTCVCVGSFQMRTRALADMCRVRQGGGKRLYI